ncbi:MAG: hypothetical protein DMC62_04830 [Verrucomicrobia bacterium]|nr:MAG: hypothetical protein DMC62_04830 [Verrucomicrobiota bacterium]
MSFCRASTLFIKNFAAEDGGHAL